jgi:pantoate--beta-alanine ligase
MLGSLGTDEVFAPNVSELYPHGYRFRVEEESITKVMEGAHRPGFFQGVMTIVLKLLNLVRPDRAYLGEKDYQQLKVIADMVKEFFIPTEIIPCPTVREESGLAESSRNTLLSPAARHNAACIFRALSSADTPNDAKAVLESEGFTVDYVEEHWGRRFAAASVDGVRLIDNVPVS